MISKYIESASSFSGEIDHLIWLVTLIVMPWFFLAEGVLLYLIVRYTAMDGVRSEERRVGKEGA